MSIISPERLAFLDEPFAIDPVGPIERPNDWWPTDNSPFIDYDKRAYFPPESQICLSGIVENRLRGRVGNIGIDVAGGVSGHALKNLISLGLLERVVVINLSDRRTPRAQADTSIEHITGDILAKETWFNIFESRERQCPEGFALVMHRPVGALQDLDPRVYAEGLGLLIDLARSDGVVFCQIPRTLMQDKPRELYRICETLHDREDIRELHVSSVNPSEVFEDYLDTYAIILKQEVG